jgi:hypothetical protein
MTIAPARAARGHAPAVQIGAILCLVALPALAAAQNGAAAGAPPAPAPRTVLPSLPEGLIREPGFLARVELADRGPGDHARASNGFYPEFSNMVSGAGWISLGPGYRHWLARRRVFVDGSTAISWRAYKIAQARVELPDLARGRLTAGAQVLWQDATQITYFGSGPSSREADRSEYRMKTTDVVGYLALHPAAWLQVGVRAGWLHRPDLLPPAGTFKRGHPDTRTVFPDDPVFQLVEQPPYAHVDATITADTRDVRGHPTSGGVYRGVWTSYVDRDRGAFSFRRYEAEAARFVPLASRRVVVALHGWIVASDTTDGREIPFYLMPGLGGSSTLRAYSSFRFHDRHAALVTVESRVALMTHVDVAAFVDAGNVASRFADLNLRKRSYGAGLRLHSTRSTLLRLDAAHGGEGWRILLRTGDPLRLARLGRRMAAAPFAP